MARADYHAQLVRHAGEYDVLPHGLLVPAVPRDDDWQPGTCAGHITLTDEILAGNRWPALSGALLAEFTLRCATVTALATCTLDEDPLPNEIVVRMRRAIPVADARTHPRVADGGAELTWSARAHRVRNALTVSVALTRQPQGITEPVRVVEADARFSLATGKRRWPSVTGRVTAFLGSLPRRLVLPAYRVPWSAGEIRGDCRERPGSLLAVAEQALGDAGKIVRGDGVPPDLEESMLIAEMTYRWRASINDGAASYIAHPGPRRGDAKGREWIDATAILSVGDQIVGEATGALVFQRFRPR